MLEVDVAMHGLNKPPLTLFAGTLKQVRLDLVGETERSFIDRCFPGFAEEERMRLVADTRLTAYGIHDLSQGRRRRYSGGPMLPRGRYFSVCSTAEGDDGRTLCSELMAYWSAEEECWTELVDSTDYRYAEPVTAAMSSEQIQSNPRPWLLVQAALLADVIEASGPIATLASRFIPLSVQSVEIADVLDLRLRSHQDWLAGVLGRSESFASFLPELLTAYRGGNINHDGIGRMVRAAGAQGLVFPSARRNASCSSTDEDVLAFDGWNFVDYRGLERDGGGVARGGLVPGIGWEQSGLWLAHWKDDGHVRSWRVEGAEEREIHRIRSEAHHVLSEVQE